jgi:hypothetical protein
MTWTQLIECLQTKRPAHVDDARALWDRYSGKLSGV